MRTFLAVLTAIAATIAVLIAAQHVLWLMSAVILVPVLAVQAAALAAIIAVILAL